MNSFTNFSFLFAFFPLFLIIYYLLPKRFRALVIFIGSSIFYFWGEPRFFPLLLLLILINYYLGLVIEKFRSRKWLSYLILSLTITFNLSLLILLKESSLIIREFGLSIKLPSWVKQNYFPLGISFFTFTTLSYLLDIFKGAISSERNFLLFLNYITFFPKVIQGPIQEFKKFREDYLSPKISTSNVHEGLTRFIFGLAKKVLIADQLGVVAQSVFTSDLSKVGAGLSWYALITYGLQIYFDFAGYTEMAIGIGRILGFELPENFNHPYTSVSIADFWRRWHITLTGWFRKYVFYPLEFKLRNIGAFRQPVNLVIVFLLTGLWHGFSLNYIVWGLYFGLILALESIGLGKILKKLPKFFQHLYSILVVLIGWVFFRLKNPVNWPLFFRAMIGLNGFTSEISSRSLNLLGYIPILLIGIILCTPFEDLKIIQNTTVNQIFFSIGKIALFIMSVAFLVEKGYFAFFYQQF